jgi:hypothetical protein
MASEILAVTPLAIAWIIDAYRNLYSPIRIPYILSDFNYGADLGRISFAVIVIGNIFILGTRQLSLTG